MAQVALNVVMPSWPTTLATPNSSVIEPMPDEKAVVDRPIMTVMASRRMVFR